MKGSTIFPIILLAMFTQGSARGSGVVQVTLTLKDGNTTYRAGEPIILDLSFAANEPGLTIESGTTEPPSPIDEIVISPKEGVSRWLDDAAGRHQYMPDAETPQQISPGEPSHILLPINSVYRIDKPGSYSAYVITHRVLSGGSAWTGQIHSGTDGIRTNQVWFEVDAMSDADEKVVVDKLVGEIRPLVQRLIPVFTAVGMGNTNVLTIDQRQDFRRDWQHGNDLVKELSWLSGDPSTRAKVDMYLHPEVFGPFSGMVKQGLWISRNRPLVVTLLEQGMKDSPQAVDIAKLTAQMKASLAGRSVDDTDRIQRKLEVEELRGIAKTLPERTDQNLAETNTTLFMRLAQAKQTGTPEFAAAREFLITHFGEVSPWHIDVLLNVYGKYLSDTRLVPSLEDFLRDQQPSILSGARNAVLRHLLLLAPSQDVRPFVAAAICDPESRMSFDILTKLPDAILPEVDQCLLQQVTKLAASADRPAQMMLSLKTPLAGRFATSAIYPQMLVVYNQYGSKWQEDARGGMLAYLARYDEKGGLELLKQGIKLGTGQPFNAVMSLCKSFYSPAVNRFFEDQLQREDDPMAPSWAASELSEHGTARDQTLIRARLDRWREMSSSQAKRLDPDQGRLEGDLVVALIHAKAWRMEEAEANRLKQSCVTEECRDRVARFANVGQTPSP
jgi:hypothetical protein